MADQILIGIDPTHAGDSLFDADFGGAPWNAPDKGPYAYKVWPKGITLNFDYSIMPADSGWVVGTVFRDSTTLTWGVEMAAYIGPPGRQNPVRLARSASTSAVRRPARLRSIPGVGSHVRLLLTVDLRSGDPSGRVLRLRGQHRHEPRGQFRDTRAR